MRLVLASAVAGALVGISPAQAYFETDPCLSRPQSAIHALDPSTSAPYSVQPLPGHTYDMRGITLFANPPLLPIEYSAASGGVCVIGAKAVGRQSRGLTWRQMKDDYDGDGIRFSRATGAFTVLGGWFENVEDAIAPPKTPDAPRAARWTVRHTYARYIRDDFVENDAALSGEVDSVLVDGTHVFLSARPSAGVSTVFPSGTVKVRDSLVRLDCKPDRRCDGEEQESRSCPRDDACGPDKSVAMIFKWSPEARNLQVDIANTILRMDDMGRNGPSSMAFPDGLYSNVTLIWLGPGPYPGRLPQSGVKVTRDTGIWDRARAEWLGRHGCSPSGDSCNMLKPR